MGWRMTNWWLLSHWRISRATVKCTKRINDVRLLFFFLRKKKMKKCSAGSGSGGPVSGTCALRGPLAYLNCSEQNSMNVTKVKRLLNYGGGESKCEWLSVNVPVIYDSYWCVSFYAFTIVSALLQGERPVLLRAVTLFELLISLRALLSYVHFDGAG